MCKSSFIYFLQISQYNIVEWSPGKEKKNTKNLEESISKSGFSVISSNWIYSVQKRISCQDVHSTSVLAWMHVPQSARTRAVGSWSHRICVQCGSRPNSMLSPPEPGWTSNALNIRNLIYLYTHLNKWMELVFHTTSGALWSRLPSTYLNIVTISYIFDAPQQENTCLCRHSCLKLISNHNLHISMARKKHKTVCRSEAPVVQAP